MTSTATFIRPFLLTLIGGAALAVFVAFAPPVQAAETQGFQISPPVTELTLDPGTSTRATMKVTNLTGQQISLQVTKQNFVAKGEEGEVELVDNADPHYSLAPWFSVPQTSLDIPPRATKEFEYSLSVPADAEPGSRYGSITFDSIPPKLASGQSGASVKQRLAALIFLRIKGDAHEQLSIASFRTDKTFYEYGPIDFHTRIQNNGNVHEKPTGQIVIKNLLGFKTATIKLDEKNVIPGAIRKVDSELKRHLMLGRYTAELTLHNGTKQTLTATTSFTVVPYKLLIAIAVGLLLVILFFWKARRRFRRAMRILAGRE